ncbi:MAG TPA: HDIG domain-containing protein [Firmicutes bacterium]|nr:HDIG domain-containing protein [Bacillota bacterium]
MNRARIIPGESLRGFDRHLLARLGEHLSRIGATGYLVGGSVRDLLLGRSPFDLDIVVANCAPIAIARWIHKEFGLSRPVRFPRFGTYHLVGEEVEVEIARLMDGPDEDASRRDFTINCLYVDLVHYSRTGRLEILDPTGYGIDDLEHARLRTPSEPALSFWLDPLRLIRAIRFRAVFGMKIDAGLRHEIARMAYLVSQPARERIRAELERILTSSRVGSALRLMQTTGLLRVILPEVDRMVGFSQRSPYHAYDLFEHTVRTVSNVPPDLVLRLSALLHDTGKIETCRRLADRNVYYGHEEASARIAESVLRRLRFSNQIIARVTFLVANHMVNYSRSWSDRAVRRFMRKMGDKLDQMLILLYADRRAQTPSGATASNITDLRRRVAALSKLVHDVLRLPIDGHEIMRILNIGEGPLVGLAKQYLYNVSENLGRPLSEDDCRRLLKEWARRVLKQ